MFEDAKSNFMANEATAKQGTSNKSDEAINKILFRRLSGWDFLNSDMIRASMISASAMPTVVVTERRGRVGAELASLTRERAYASGFRIRSATNSSQESSRDCRIRRLISAAAG